MFSFGGFMRTISLAAAWLGLLLHTSLFAQGVRANLVGRITDESGAVVQGVKVSATNAGTNETRTMSVGEAGEFSFPQLLPGQYTLTAEQTGFRKEVIRGILLETGQSARIDVILKVGSVTETVEVTAATPLISSENANVGAVVDQKKVVELPLNGRDYLQLALMAPGVAPPAQGSTLGFRGGINVAGHSEVANQYIKDGIDNNDETTNQPLHRPILDAVREFKVLTGTYGAEYGRQAGGQIIVTTRGGTNDFHGTLWEFHRNSVLDARNFFAPTKPSFRRNQFGAVAGGKLVRDRTFYFVGYEGQRRGQQEATLAVVPTQAMKRGDFSGLAALRDPRASGQTFPNNQVPQSRWSTQGAGLLALYPDPNTAGRQNIASTGTGAFRIDQFSARIDHRLNDKDSLFGVYEFADNDEVFPLSNPLCSARDVPGWGCDEMQRTQHSVLTWTRIFSPNLVNEARVGYTRFGFFRLQQDRDVDVINRLGIGGLTDAGKTPFNNGAPQTNATGFVVIGGPTNLPQGRHDNHYHVVDNITWIKGKHTVKFGFDMRKFLFNSFFTSFGRGAFVFDGRFSGNSIADLLLGLPQQGDRNLGEPFHNAITFSSGFYVQDDVKISPNLTLNLGVRYELNLPVTERVDKLASFDMRTNTLAVAGGRESFVNPATGLLEFRARPDVGRRLWETDANNFAPRVGLAWRPFGGPGTVIRAGAGVFYNLQIAGNGITPLSRNSPFRNRQTAGPFLATDSPNLANVFTVGRPAIVPPGIQHDFRTAYVTQWSFGIQKELMQNFVLDTTYVGAQGHKLPVSWQINQALPGPGAAQARRPFQPFGNITGGFAASIGNSNFHSLQVRLERRLTSGLSFLSSYTWSRSIDDAVGISTSSDAAASMAQDARNLRAERGLSDFDVRQRWAFSTVYDLPFGKGRHFASSSPAVNAIIGGWQLTGILTLQAGRPFTVRSGRDESNTGVGTTTDRPNVIGDWRIPNPTPERWFNPCTLTATGARRNCAANDTPAWQINALNTFGNAGRNILIGDGLANLDFGLYRSFRIKEKMSLQFRTEFFNLTNHPNFFLPIISAAGADFSQISRSAQTGTGAQRQIQFGLKLVF
ncbi:MAG: TonB-dependent receptor [Acidimicrobiia bacterium]|nr:TonB-dependent receptor [Acidimicrobiia bacterium]